jgi:tRNA-dihydrouridine synthase A
MYGKILKNNDKIFSIAPMMDWTDRHCRFFHRLMTKHALLYSEMIVADAVIHGDRDYLLGGSELVRNVALQLGGSDPAKLARASAIGMEFGYNEINLNVGCPSDRVKSGTFGACLMREPQIVGDCVRAMKDAVSIPVTVKCRIGVDEQDSGPALDCLSGEVWNAGCDGLWVHARKAWLEGLSPKENREVPPLDYQRVYRLKSENISKFVGINGGIEDLDQCIHHLGKVDAVMVGRGAYQRPAMLRDVDRTIFGSAQIAPSFTEICRSICEYAEDHLRAGGRIHQITRHMSGLFHGESGSRRYRQILAIEAVKKSAGPDVIQRAFEAIGPDRINHAA